MQNVIKHDMDPNSNINYRRKIPPEPKPTQKNCSIVIQTLCASISRSSEVISLNWHIVSSYVPSLPNTPSKGKKNRHHKGFGPLVYDVCTAQSGIYDSLSLSTSFLWRCTEFLIMMSYCYSVELISMVIKRSFWVHAKLREKHNIKDWILATSYPKPTHCSKQKMNGKK